MPETSSPSPALDRVRIGIVSISDRASSGVYEDKGLPALRDWLGRAVQNPIDWEPRLIADEQALISQTLIELVDLGCDLVLTTGGTGPAKRDVTPEATLAVADKEMPGFGGSLRKSPSAARLGTETGLRASPLKLEVHLAKMQDHGLAAVLLVGVP